MNQQQALVKLRKTIGDKLAWRVDKDAPDAEQREVILAAWREAKARADAAVAAREARLNQVLLEDAVSQKLKAEAQEAQHAASVAGHGLHSHRITVGRDLGWCFSVVADGDNWAEVVEKAAKGT